MFHKVIQVVPTSKFTVYIYFEDGKIKLFDANDLITRGVFRRLQDKDFFINTCTVMNNTLAWDTSGRFDPSDCLDLDPDELYSSCPDVEEPNVYIVS